MRKKTANAFFALQRFETAGKQEFLLAVGVLQARYELAAEDAAEHLYGQEKSVARMDPPLAV